MKKSIFLMSKNILFVVTKGCEKYDYVSDIILLKLPNETLVKYILRKKMQFSQKQNQIEIIYFYLHFCLYSYQISFIQ
jgi:hypothetical protein